MVDRTVGNAIHFPTRNIQSPAHVNLLVMSEEARIQTANTVIVVSTYHQAGTCCPHHGRGIIILSVILFHGVKNSSSTKRITVTVKIATTGTCVFKRIFVEYRQQFWLAGSHLGMAVHELYQRHQPAVSNLHITVEQHIIGGFHLSERKIITLGEAPVLLQFDDAHLWMMCFEPLNRTVGRGIVGHINHCVLTRIEQNIRKILLHHLLSVPVQDNNCDLIHIHQMISAIKAV